MIPVTRSSRGRAISPLPYNQRGALYWFYYLDQDGTPHRIKAAKRPSATNGGRHPGRGSIPGWTVHRHYTNFWSVPEMPWITWSVLQGWTYLGCVPLNSDEEAQGQ